MFNFNKKKRLIEGPIEFTAEIEIERAASEVFPLVDVGDPRFSHTQFGADVVADEGSQNHYTLEFEAFDDAVFDFVVLERIEGRRHKAETKMIPQMFALVKAIEEYSVEPTGDNACRLKLVTNAEFDPDLSDEDVAAEIATMSEAVNADLAKLKTLAEEGLEAVLAMEEAEMTLDIEFDLGDLDIDWDDIEPQQ